MRQKETKNCTTMKHYLLTTLLLLVALTNKAATYDYMVFETNDGTQLTMTANGLKLVYKDGVLTATNGTVTQTFSTSKLSRMFFSNTKQGDDATGISDLKDSDNLSNTEIYDLSGRRLPQGTKPTPGLYIFKKGNTTTKKYVK